MTYATRATGTIDRLVRAFGGGATVTVRRMNTLKNRATQKGLFSLFVNGTVAAGEASIVFDSPNLDGVLVSGSKWTVAGDATVYTTSADATASGGQVTVTFTPVLAAEAADDAAVTISQDYGEDTYAKATATFRDSVISGQGIDLTDRKLILTALGEASEINDKVPYQILDNGERLNVKDLRPHKPGTVAAGYVVVVRQ